MDRDLDRQAMPTAHDFAGNLDALLSHGWENKPAYIQSQSYYRNAEIKCTNRAFFVTERDIWVLDLGPFNVVTW